MSMSWIPESFEGRDNQYMYFVIRWSNEEKAVIMTSLPGARPPHQSPISAPETRNYSKTRPLVFELRYFPLHVGIWPTADAQ